MIIKLTQEVHNVILGIDYFSSLNSVVKFGNSHLSLDYIMKTKGSTYISWKATSTDVPSTVLKLTLLGEDCHGNKG